MNTTTISVDLAKRVFQVSVANRAGRIVERKRLTRGDFQKLIMQQPPSDMVFEACATAHHWARLASAHGHNPRLLHANYVRPYVRRNKTDAADADALLRAAQDPDLMPVPCKTETQQAIQGLHRIRAQYQDTRRQRLCLARGLLAEFGVVLPTGVRGARQLRGALDQVPDLLAESLTPVLDEIAELEQRLKALDTKLSCLASEDPVAQRLMSIPGVGVTTATALLGSVPAIHAFRRARQFSAWLGLTPHEHSSGQRRRLGAISKRGDVYLRTLLTHGARSALLMAHRQARKGEAQLTELQRWALDVERRTCHNKATIALANKMARIIWCVWTREDIYRA